MTQPRRKGASRIADISPEILTALNEGREETATLVEWLAIDMPTLVANVAPQVGLADQTTALVSQANDLEVTVQGRGAELVEPGLGMAGGNGDDYVI